MHHEKDQPNERPPVVHYVVAESRVAVTEQAFLRKSNETLGDVGYVASDGSDGSASRTDRQEDGSYSRTMEGPPVPGEADTLRACRNLIQYLNMQGAAWSDPIGVPDDETKTDAISMDGARTLRMQHTRADGDPNIYHSLAKAGKLDARSMPEELSARLGSAISHKASRTVNPQTRASLVLVLDAQRLPEFCMSEVKAAALRDLAQLSSASGFGQIFVVGPLPEMTFRLWPTD